MIPTSANVSIDVKPRRPGNEPGEWIKNLEGVRRVLYRLPELLAADPAEPVFLVEGEKDVEDVEEVEDVAYMRHGELSNLGSASKIMEGS